MGYPGGVSSASPAVGDEEMSLVSVEGNKPLLLSDPDAVWIVQGGKVDVFAVPLDGPDPAGPGRHLLRAQPGDALFGVTPAADGRLALIARGAPGTVVRRCSQEALRAPDTDRGALDRQQVVERWIANLASAMGDEITPQIDVFLETGREQVLRENAVAMPREGVLWLTVVDGSVCLLGRPELTLPMAPRCVPLPYGLWMRSAAASTVRTVGSDEAFARDAVWPGLALFHELVVRALHASFEAEEQHEQRRLAQKAEAQQAVVQRAWRQIGTLLAPEDQPLAPLADGSDPVLAACRMAGETMGIRIETPRGASPTASITERVHRIASASGMRTRTVGLRGGWWHADSGPLVATIEKLDRPVTLLPSPDHGYDLYDPVAGTRTRVTDEVAGSLGAFATSFYRPFPERGITSLELIRFGLRGARRDLQMVVLMGTLVAMLGLLTPLAIRHVFDTLIPAAERGQLVQIGLLVVVVGVAITVFDVVRNVALLRVESRMGNAVQAALWDRLLNLPTPFFRRYTAGDLGQRAMGASALRAAVSGPVVSAVFAGMLAVANLALLVYLDKGLALGALLLAALGVGVTGLAGYLQLKHQRAVAAQAGGVSGLVLQLINGMAKLRVAGVEGRAFALWADAFSRQKKLDYRARKLRAGLTAFHASYPLLTTMALIAMIAWSSRGTLSTGTFLAFNAAFGQLLGAGLQLSGAVIAMLRMLPLYERARPILESVPEIDPGKTDPGELNGDIEVKHVFFRYKQDGPLILRDVSLHIRPGEFVALVGGSGSGKSTLFRLLLGFETPESGAIYYDGRDLSQIDLRSVRQQIGVVLQHGKLLSGSILENIIGSAPLTLDDAMEAARMAGLDGDIREMPMGMHTYLSEGGGTLSGGQRQRLLIARAIVKRPRIVFFDEATSALDNRTQQIVSQSLERLQATRIVIAHRLSTIINADRIFVLDGGKIVQSGSYNELIDQPGLFADLAKRQLM